MDVKLERSEKKLDVKNHAGKNVLNFKPVDRKSHVNKVLEDDEQWTTIGEADYIDAITAAPLGDLGIDAPMYKVAIQEMNDQQGYYRLVNIHDNNPLVGEDNLSLADPEADSYLIFNTIDLAELGAPMLSDESNYNLLDPFNDREYKIAYYPTMNNLGSVKDGVITFSAGSIYVGLGMDPFDALGIDDEDNTIILDEYKDKVFPTTEDLVIVLPGATYDPSANEKDYSFAMVQNNLCAGDDNNALFAFAGGEDIATYKYLISGDRYKISEENLDIVAEIGNVISSPGTYNISMPTQGWYTVFVVGLNEAGERVAGDGLYFYSYAHNPEEWTSLGNVLFTDDTFGPLYGLDDANPVEVEILVNKDNSSLYRLVNPYAKNQLVEEAGIILHSNHNHYLDIDATDPDKVIINEMPIGVSINTTAGMEHITILALSGKFANNKITFPERMVGVGTYGLGDEGPWLANKSGKFSVEFPCTLNVKAFNDDEPVEGATVKANGKEVVTNGMGEATMSLYGVLGTKVSVEIFFNDLYWEGEADFTEGADAWVIAENMAVPYVINVTAIDKNEEPVADAIVNADDKSATTDENGKATLYLKSVKDNKSFVSIYKDYMYWECEADFTEGKNANITAKLLNPDCTLTVIAFDKDEEPVAGAFVTVGSKEAETDENGRAVINVGDVIGTKVSVTVMKDYMFWEGEADFTEGMETTVVAELKNPDCTLTVIAFDKDEEPVAGAFVTVGSKEAETDENGRAVINVGDVIGTKVSVTVMKDYMFWEGEADFTEGMETTVVAELKNPDCTLNIKVFDDKDEPLADAKVVANGVETNTDENGNAVINVGDVIGTKVAITVTKDGYEDGVGEADFTEGMEAYATVILKAKTVGLTLAIIEADKNIKVYDLNGRRVENPAAGNIYIIDGKKVRIMK